VVEANEEYRRIADRCPTLVAMDDEPAVGLVTVVRRSPHTAELHVMAVHADHHRRGIRRVLIESVEARLRSEGVFRRRLRVCEPPRNGTWVAGSPTSPAKIRPGSST
jgi:GNAT superfamily N-acetyltransferase